MTIIVAGAGIAGLTLALSLHQVGRDVRLYEAAPSLRPLGVGINLLPHAMREMRELGLEAAIAANAVELTEFSFYNRFGQFIFAEPRGRAAGYDWAQNAIHRGTLQTLLLEAVRERLGPDAIVTGHRFVAAEQDAEGITARFVDGATGAPLPPVRGEVLVGADGVRSAVRAMLHPDDGPFVYSGITMWRGAAYWPTYLGGGTMVCIGAPKTGELVVYPITAPDAAGRQLTNWICMLEMPPRQGNGDWSLEGRREDFFWTCRGMSADWLDIPGMVAASARIWEYPMVDKDPLPRWSFGRITVAGDAAHPMYPRGSNGAGQSILDARSLAGHLARESHAEAALRAYERDRMGPTGDVVRANRTIAPDTILREVFDRTGDTPFESIDAVISRDELVRLSDSYKRVAGFERDSLAKRRSLV